MLSEETTQRLPVAKEDFSRRIRKDPEPEGGMKFLQLKRHDELVKDSDFYFQLSRLIGMTEMLTTYMKIHGDEKSKEMAERADRTLSFFFEG